jgi:CarD family transcriptional regulator, regulator of rRNA transcription
MQLCDKNNAERRWKRMFQVGQLAVYPAHGVGRIESVQERAVSGNDQEKFYIMRLLDTDMIIMIPTGNARNIGLRDIIDLQAVTEIYDILRHRPLRLNNQTWNRRYRDYMDKIKTGSPFRVAEVLRDLTLLKTEKDLSFGERKMLDTAKNLLVKELSLVNNSNEDEIEAELLALLEAGE